jgi:hypothetical protein
VLKLLFIFLNFSLMCTFLFLSDSGVFPIVAGDAILRGERERWYLAKCTSLYLYDTCCMISCVVIYVRQCKYFYIRVICYISVFQHIVFRLMIGP